MEHKIRDTVSVTTVCMVSINVIDLNEESFWCPNRKKRKKSPTNNEFGRQVTMDELFCVCVYRTTKEETITKTRPEIRIFKCSCTSAQVFRVNIFRAI